MRHFVWLTVGFIGFFSVATDASYTLVDSVPSASAWVIPYQKYQLNNGLTVILHEDHSDPMVHIEVMYHVGSAMEEVGKSGFAHFFEHMMFQGSKHVPYNAHFKIITEAGGKMNGSASRDRTNYYQTVPKNQLETVLWMESDRMGFFLDGINQKKFEVQRDTVKNEKAQNYDNRPYGLSGEYLYRTHYPYGHPYSWLTIGNVPDLDRVSVDDLKSFFQQWYRPNNAVLVIAGDISSSQVIAMVDRYFSSIESGATMTRPKPWVPTLTDTQYVSYEDPLVELPQLTMVFPSPPRHHPDEPALDCLAMALGSGTNSRLYQALVKPRLAMSVEAYNYTSERSGEFVISVTPFAGTSLNQIKQIVDEVVASVLTNPVHADDVTRFVAGYQVGSMRRLESVEEKAGILAFDEILTGDPGFFTTESARYQSVSTANVADVYRKYLYQRPSTVLSVVPKGQGQLVAAPDSVQKPLNRAVRPTPDVAPLPPVLPIWTTSLKGLSVKGAMDSSSELVRVQLVFPGGNALAAQLGFPAGTAPFLAAMMMQDTTGFSAETINLELEKLGSSISIIAGPEEMTISIQALQSHLDETIRWVKERLENPAFSEADFQRIHHQTVEGIKAASVDSDRIAEVVVGTVIYDKGHPLRDVYFTTDAVQSIKIQTLKEAHKALFSRSKQIASQQKGISVSTVGPLTVDQVHSALIPLNLYGYAAPLKLNFPVNQPTESRIVLVDLPGSTQAELRIVMPGMVYDVTGNYFLAQLFNFPIGGNFNSRINMQLREVRGISYGAYSYFKGTEFPGYFEISAAIKGDKVGVAIQDSLDILKRAGTQGITESDLEYLKNAILQRDALKYETGDQKLGVVATIQKYRTSDDYLIERAALIRSVSLAQLNQIGVPFFNQPRTIVVVGDAKKVRPQLESLGIPIQEYPVSQFIW